MYIYMHTHRHVHIYTYPYTYKHVAKKVKYKILTIRIPLYRITEKIQENSIDLATTDSYLKF